MIRVAFGIIVGIPFVVFAGLTIRPPSRSPAVAGNRRGIRLVLLSGTLMFAGLACQVIFPFGAELHADRVASLTATGLLLLVSLICLEAGMFSNFGQARRAAVAGSTRSGNTGVARRSDACASRAGSDRSSSPPSSGQT